MASDGEQMTKWIPANENDIGKMAQFFDFPGDDPVYGILLDTDGSQSIQGVKCCSAYWCDTGNDDDEPLRFNCCEVQEDKAQSRVEELESAWMTLLGDYSSDYKALTANNQRLKQRIEQLEEQRAQCDSALRSIRAYGALPQRYVDEINEVLGE